MVPESTEDDGQSVEVGEDERQLAASFVGTRAYQLADWSTSNLAVALHESAELPREADAARHLVGRALQVASARTFRLARSGMAVLASGYEGEARIMDRALFETRGRLIQVLADPTGKTAERWLRGDLRGGLTDSVRESLPGIPGERVNALYRFLSGDTHPDARHQLTVLLEQTEDGTNTTRFGPGRGPAAERSLLLYGWLPAEITERLGLHYELSLPHHAQLADALLAWAGDLHRAQRG